LWDYRITLQIETVGETGVKREGGMGRKTVFRRFFDARIRPLGASKDRMLGRAWTVATTVFAREVIQA